MHYTIERPQKQDRETIKNLFQEVITDTFQKNKIPEAYQGEINDLIVKNISNVDEDFRSNGTNEYFLVARADDSIVGIMGYGKPNNDIRKLYKIDFTKIPEIKNAFILPAFQKQGIGTKLFEKLKNRLIENGFKEFILDSGFTSAQVYWKMKLGEPIIVKKNYWDDGTDYMIWHTKLL